MFPHEREELIYGGIGPGDSYIGTWRIPTLNSMPSRVFFRSLAAQLDRNPIRVKPAEVHTSGAREAVERDYAKLMLPLKPHDFSIGVPELSRPACRKLS